MRKKKVRLFEKHFAGNSEGPCKQLELQEKDISTISKWSRRIIFGGRERRLTFQMALLMQATHMNSLCELIS